jgi:adenylate cyclase
LFTQWLLGNNFLCVSTSEEGEAWLELKSGGRRTLHGSCSFGRSAANTVVLDSPKVSRRHALIHVQNIGEFWLIDFGSTNGTFLNHRRIQKPVRLNDGDQITIGDSVLVFRQPTEISEQYNPFLPQRPLRQVEDSPCWLLVADIRGFTPLSRSMKTDALETLVGQWVGTCKEIIENYHGLINKYLGDGFLAYWRTETTTPEEIAAAIAGLRDLQRQRSPDFRIVVHLGLVAIGGVASMGEESLMGRDVNFVFRLEELAASLGETCGLSEAAQLKLAALMPSRPLGEHELKGFERKHAFFAAS